ncbi:methyl-accepting chemotaxis protein [Stutzerimonas azotifigens]|uniref:Methyl-accepting chemotaxis protein n=1 Tax=Stutzerimonas azotifigens TaxID=291995 RepID=A0ABR5Z5C6_9GAMM|nr:methyl-accepting chemotaxis protein [Stutzerimonas azotifigens]MBA1275340.1 methyl-accepting chemotaxis protein [Stutzerimonas azotifigens]
MLLRRLKVGPRAVLGFSTVALLVIVLGLFAQGQMKGIRGATVEVMENTLPSFASLGAISDRMLRLRIISFRILVDREEAQLRSTVARGDELVQELSTAVEGYSKLISSDAERAQFAQFKEALTAYVGIHKRLVQLSNAGDMEGVRTLLGGDYNLLSIKLGAQLAELVKINNAAAEAVATQSQEQYDRANFGVMVSILLAVALTILLAILFTRSIVAPLGEAVKAAEAIANGDLARTIHVSGNDEPGRLLGALQSMQQSLRGTLQGIVDSSTRLASAAEELNAVTENSSQMLQQQNHEIEQAATAVNEMTAAVDEVASNATATSEASRAADQTAGRGRQQVEETIASIGNVAENAGSTVEQVTQLADSVRSISTVLDVIRSIAEQTNLLALNAAIEAARAGDAGRGFAVVADEVRALAHRTQQSTHEIEQMIASTQQGAEQAMSAMQTGNQQAQETLHIAHAAGEALQQITAAFSQITERNLVIASASEEQAQVAREVDRNLVNIRDLALQTSAGAHQTNAASQELARLAVDLNGLVSRFKLA